MPRLVKGPDGVTHAFPDDATDDEVRSALGGDKPAAPLPKRPVSAEDFTPSRSWPAKIGDAVAAAGNVALGFGKGVLDTAASTIEKGANARVLPGVTPDLQGIFSTEEERNPAFRKAEDIATPTNTAQSVGKGLETATELLVPAGQAANAIPRTARAGAKFAEVAGAAGHIPINAEAPGQVGLKIMQLTEQGGGSLPRPVSQFLQWVTNPDKEPMTYDVAKRFASGISRLSANEAMRMSPSVAREVAELRVTLNKAVGEAAAKAGKGREYAEAMNEYAKAMKLRGAIEEAATSAKKALPLAGAGAIGGAAGAWLTKKALDLLGGD